jgi:kynurenine formamidase
MRATRLIDLSHELEHGMITYKGLPGPVICEYLTREASRALYARGTEFHIGKIEMVANTCTYVDAPFHRYADGKDLANLPLESLAHLEAVVIRNRGPEIGAEAFAGLGVRDKAVLVHSGWDRHWRTSRYLEGHPYLTRDAARTLANGGAALVGIDSHNIDDTRDGTRPAHTILLGAGIPICEHMCNLGSAPDAGFRFYAVPVKVKAFGTFPVRAFALVEEE